MQKLDAGFVEKWKTLFAVENRTIVTAQLYSSKPEHVVRVQFSDSNAYFYITWFDAKCRFVANEPLAGFMTSNPAFVGAGIKVRMGEGDRYSIENEVPLPSPGIICNPIPYRFNNDSLRCVPGSFANAMGVLGCLQEMESYAKLYFERNEMPYLKCKAMLNRDKCQTRDLKFDKEHCDHYAYVEELDRKHHLPMILCLKGMQKNAREHCICVFNGQIYDGLNEKSCALTKHHMDNAVGYNDHVVSISKGLIIDPSKTVKSDYYKKHNLPDKSVFDNRGIHLIGE